MEPGAGGARWWQVMPPCRGSGVSGDSLTVTAAKWLETQFIPEGNSSWRCQNRGVCGGFYFLTKSFRMNAFDDGGDLLEHSVRGLEHF